MKKLVSVICFVATFLSGGGTARAERLPYTCGHGTTRRLQEATLERFNDGVWGVPCVFMARSAAEWKVLMNDMVERGELVITPAIDPPDVNWKRDNVIVVSLGEMPTSGYGIEIKGVNKMAGTALLDLTITVPADDIRPQVLTFPYHMIRVLKVGLREVEVCHQVLSYEDGSDSGPALDWNGTFENLTTQEPSLHPETWGGIKARFR